MNVSTKTSRNKESRGFTLVEMLVVIGMIAALAGVSFPVYRGIQKKIEKQKIELMLVSIERAVDNFETEYNYLPFLESSYPSEETSYYWTNNGIFSISRFLGILMGLEDTLNFKQIAFLELPEAEGNGPGSSNSKGPHGFKNGVVIDGELAVFYSHYGFLIAARLDYDQNNEIYCNTLTETVTGNKKILLWTPDDDVFDKTDRSLWLTNWDEVGGN
jgi:prepilin-type N-terminal cleavage/methylation domain-containing protein